MMSVVVLLCGALGTLLRWGNMRTQTTMAEETVRLPIAMYHSVTEEGNSPGEYVISPNRLEQDLQYLKRAGWETVTVQDVIAYVQDGTPLPEQPVMLTFDDGYYNNYINVYPLLEEYGMKAVLSPVGTLTEEFSQSDEAEHEAWSYCTGAELQEMADSGVMEMQNHSFDFHELTPRRGCLRMQGESEQSYREVFCADTEKAQAEFVALGIEEPVCYTYPYGARNAESDALVDDCGFLSSLSCEEGINYLSHEPECLKAMKRWNRDGRLSTEEFWSMVREEME